MTFGLSWSWEQHGQTIVPNGKTLTLKRGGGNVLVWVENIGDEPWEIKYLNPTEQVLAGGTIHSHGRAILPLIDLTSDDESLTLVVTDEQGGMYTKHFEITWE